MRREMSMRQRHSIILFGRHCRLRLTQDKVRLGRASFYKRKRKKERRRGCNPRATRRVEPGPFTTRGARGRRAESNRNVRAEQREEKMLTLPPATPLPLPRPAFTLRHISRQTMMRRKERCRAGVRRNVTRVKNETRKQSPLSTREARCATLYSIKPSLCEEETDDDDHSSRHARLSGAGNDDAGGLENSFAKAPSATSLSPLSLLS